MTEEITKDIRVAFTDYMDKVDTLAKQNNELKQENKELKDVNEVFKKALDELNRKYTEVLMLAKINADSNEYCLQELEQKVEQYSSALNTIQRMVLSAWEQGKYLDGGLYNDLINEFAKINEVLK